MTGVDWSYFDKFNNITDKYLPDYGEGTTMATQAVTAICKLVYKWYNDGDVYDNNYYLSGWANDLSSYANWLYKYIPETQAILDRISRIYSEGEYEDILKELADTVFTEDYLLVLDGEPVKDSIYSADGDFSFTYEDEDEWW